MKYAERLSRLGTETAFEVLAKAKALEAQGRDIIHLQIGEPDFDTPRNVKDAAIKALNEGWTHYTASAGIYEMRKKYAEYVSKFHKVDVAPEEIVITPGAKPVLFLGILALVDEGDEVVYPNPGYPIYHSVANFLGAKCVPMILREEDDFRFNVDELKKLVNPKTKLIIINTPQNPTGGILTKSDLEVIAELAHKYDCYVLSDEVYSRIVYEGEHVGILSIPGMKERAVLLDGHSKTYAMTGWRLGYAVVNKDLAVWMTRLMTNANSCTAAFTQIAGAEALLGDQSSVEKMVAEFKARRDLIVKGLNSIPGISCTMPKGAFYVWPNFKSLGRSSKFLEEYFLNDAGVACLSGAAFGSEGEGYIRFSYANSQENIKKALERVASAVEKLRKSEAVGVSGGNK
jgi:aspartate/methionine/tyrosine aminotransferase